MKEIKMLTRENIPCWYELSFRKTKPAIVLRVHKDFIKSTAPVSDDAPIVADFKKQFSFKSFIGTFDGNFGFDNAFIRKGEKREFVEFVIQIPVIKKDAGICDYCNGSGEGDFLDGKCLSCNGSGRDYELDWRMADAISASLTIFFNLSWFPEVETSSLLDQLMTIETITVKDAHGGSLWGEFSISLCNWLYSLEQSGHYDIPEIIESMQTTHRKMYVRLDSYTKHSFRAYVRDNGRLTLDCPGDACGIHNSPEDSTGQMNRGRKFNCHNVDHLGQQLTLLSGLATLHDKARKEIET
ncbi:MAG: hypothetical protein ABIJ43_05760 [Candidatus Beckwithbacteria bacterium]